MTMGRFKYGEGNWSKATNDAAYRKDNLNHLQAHLRAVLDGDLSEDHLSHIVCCAMFAMHFQPPLEKDAMVGNETSALEYWHRKFLAGEGAPE
jgi:hypothetical protein